MATVFHLALASDWEAAQEAGAYTVSTRGRTLAEEGFIHASRGDQWPGVRDRFYADLTEPLLLLKIDTERLDVPVVDEPAETGSSETFPHIYGPLPLDAVVQAIPIGSAPASEPAAAAAQAPVAPATPAPPPSATPAEHGTDPGVIFLREMFRNVLVLVVLLAFVMGGAVVGNAVRDDGYGALAGLALGVVIGVPAAILTARWLRRDDPAPSAQE